MSGKVRWVYEGIKVERRQRGVSYYSLSSVLSASEDYFKELWESSFKYYMSSDTDEMWREHAEFNAHTAYCCPHENKEAYKNAVRGKFEDTRDREKWAYDLANDAAHDQLREAAGYGACDPTWVAYFLREHPVCGVIDANGNERALSEIEGYCNACGEPYYAECIKKEEQRYECPECGDNCPTDPGDDRPVHWPPTAPWPPRCDFFGNPLEVQEFEEAP
jgi:hypothetical protein